MVKFAVDFNSGAVNTGGWCGFEYPSNNPSAMSLSNAQVRNGANSNKVFLQSTDSPAQFGNTRVELVHNCGSSPDGTLRWWAWSWYFPSASMPSDSRECVIAQWHDKSPDCSASPPLAIEAKNDKLRAMIRYNDSLPSYCANSGATVLQIFDLGNIPKDQWVDFVVFADLKYTSDGRVQIWMNSAANPNDLIFDYTGKCFYRGSITPYFKIGVYKWLWDGSAVVTPSSLTFYLDRIRIADAASVYNDVAFNPTGVNLPPVVNAGIPQEVLSTTTNGSLTGTATDGDGTIASTTWSFVSGPNTPTIVSPSSLTTNITGLIQGLYTFRLSATDNLGSTTTATTTFRVNIRPTINLSANTTNFPAGTTSVNLTSVITDVDGTITTRLWNQISGPPSTIVTPAANNTTVNGLIDGVTYTYHLTVFDNNGESAEAELQVAINSPLLNILRINKRVQ